MDDFVIPLLLALAWAYFAMGCLLAAAAVWVIHDAMKELYYQKLDVLNRIKARDEAT